MKCIKNNCPYYKKERNKEYCLQARNYIKDNKCGLCELLPLIQLIMSKEIDHGKRPQMGSN